MGDLGAASAQLGTNWDTRHYGPIISIEMATQFSDGDAGPRGSATGLYLIVGTVAVGGVLVALFGARADYSQDFKSSSPGSAPSQSVPTAAGPEDPRNSSAKDDGDTAQQAAQQPSLRDRVRFAYRAAGPGIPLGPRRQPVWEVSAWIESPPLHLTRVEYAMSEAYEYNNPMIASDGSTSFKGRHHVFGCIGKITLRATIADQLVTIPDIDWCERLNVNREFEPQRGAVPLAVENRAGVPLCSPQVRSRGQWLELSPQRIEPGAQAVGSVFPGELVDVQASRCAHPSKRLEVAHHAIDSQATAVNVALARDAGAL